MLPKQREGKQCQRNYEHAHPAGSLAIQRPSNKHDTAPLSAEHLFGELVHALLCRRDQGLRQALSDSSGLGARQKRKHRSQRRSGMRALRPGAGLVHSD